MNKRLFVLAGIIFFASIAVFLTTFSITRFAPDARAAGTTYYVSTAGSDANTCAQATNPATPKRTIQQGVNCATAAGDIVDVMGGTYTEEVTISGHSRDGAAGNPKIIRAHNSTPTSDGDLVTWTTAGAAPCGLTGIPIRFVNTSYWRLQGFTFSNIQHNRAVWLVNDGIKTTSSATSVVGIEIINNAFNAVGTDGYDGVSSGCMASPIILEKAGYATTYSGPTVNLIQNNTFDQSWGHMIGLDRSSDTLIDNNVATNLRGSRNSSNANLYQTAFIGAGTDEARRNIIQNNTIGPMTIGARSTTEGFEMSGIRFDVGAFQNIIQNNIIKDIYPDMPISDTKHGAYGIFMENNSNENIVRRNIFYRIGFRGVLDGGYWNNVGIANQYLNNTFYGAGKSCFTMAASVNTIVKNNIFVECSRTEIETWNKSDANTGLVFGNNLYWNSGRTAIGRWKVLPDNPPAIATLTLPQWASAVNGSGGGNTSSGEVSGNPLFANPSAGDFRLCTGVGAPVSSCTGKSPAIDAGVNVGLPYNGTAPDIGALESSASGTPTPTPTATPSPTTSAHINAGGPSHTASDGVYAADAYFTGGVTFSNTDAIANTTDDVLYNTERYGNPFSYNIPLQNGNYNVTLKFAETIFTAPNVRVFDVLMEDTERISNLDLYQTAGADTAYDVTLPVTVSDGTLNIIFRADVENAKINAIKVVPAPSGPTACHLYTPGSTIPSGFGVPWDVFSANELLIRATCQNLTDATLDFGRGVSTQYIYNTGYHYHTGLAGWMPMALTSTEALISNAWYPRTATATLSGLDLTNTTHYALGYVCSWNGSSWKCGCRDASCTQSYWQIQSFKR